MTTTHDPERLLPIPEVCRLLGIPKQRAWYLCRTGAIAAVTLARRYYVPESELDALVERARDEAAERARARSDAEAMA